MIGVVVNTCALGPRSGEIQSSGHVAHKARIAVLERDLLPRLCTDPLVNEVVVSGEWREPTTSEPWRYVSSPSIHFDCVDALQQRENGAKATTADILVFLHDDHVPAPDFFDVLTRLPNTWDVLVPERRTIREGKEIVLSNGRMEYVMGHCCVLRRAIWEQAPWSSVPPVFTWDVCHSFLLRERGARIRWSNELIVYDAETALGAQPWK